MNILTWKHFERCIRLVEVSAIVGAAIFAGIQLNDLRLNKSAELMLQFDATLAEKPTEDLIVAIEDKKPIFVANGGRFRALDVDRLLGTYELIGNLRQARLMNDTMLYDAFSYDIEKTYEHPEIRNYLTEIRELDSALFVGFEELAKNVISQ